MRDDSGIGTSRSVNDEARRVESIGRGDGGWEVDEGDVVVLIGVTRDWLEVVFLGAIAVWGVLDDKTRDRGPNGSPSTST